MAKGIKLPTRLRLVRLLRAHGLRQVERMREDELRRALKELGISLAEGAPPPPEEGANGPSSSTCMRPHPEGARPVPSGEEEAGEWDDPHALPRFREPRLFVPEGRRTFLRLIAVDPTLLFCTWDLDEAFWKNPPERVELRLLRADAEDLLSDELCFATAAVDAGTRNRYLPAPGERIAVKAVLVAFAGGKPRVLAESNRAIVPPSRPAPPGPLWFARISPHADRRRLRDGALLAALAGQDVELPEGVEVFRTGRDVPSPGIEPGLSPSSAAWAARMGPLPSSGMPWSPAPWSGTFHRQRSKEGERR